MTVVLETEHHFIEFEDRKTEKEFKKFCKELNVSHDYYMFEFDVDVEE